MISIVVPVYNVEPYLAQCIESILRQTYKDFELILVDDGSPDHSGAICDEFAARDTRIRVIHQTNGGVSKARNAGIDIAIGEWICFVDADDILTPKYLEYFYRNADTHCDLLIQGRWKMVGGCLKSRFVFRIDAGYMSRRDFVSNPSLMAYCTPWGKLFKSSVIKSKQVFFPEGIDYGEDSIFFFRYLAQVDKIRTIASYRYIYRDDNSSSATKNDHDPFVYLRHLEDVFDALSELIKLTGVNITFLSNRIQDRVITILQYAARRHLSAIEFKHLISSIRNSRAVCLQSIHPTTFKLSILFFLIKNLPSSLLCLIVRLRFC